MKKMILMSVLFASLVANAQSTKGGSDIGSGTEPQKPFSTKLFMLKTIFSDEDANLLRLEKDSEARAEAYKAAGFFSLATKSRLSRTNCALIEAHTASRAIMLSALAEADDQDASKVQVDDEVGTKLVAATKNYFAALKGAQDTCSNISKSITYIKNAREQATYVNRLLKKIDNGILDRQ